MARRAAALHILVESQAEAESLLQKLKRGAQFQTLARRHSRCPSKRQGGDLGEFTKGSMVPEFDRAVFSGPLLTPIGPIKTRFGYHLIKVLYRS